MNHWLLKSEPSSYSWQQLVADKRTSWNGVRNHQASNNMKAMKKGDRAFFYHSGEGPAVVGICEILREYYPDPSDETGRFGMVDVGALAAMRKPVSLAAIKAEKKLANFALVRQGRLSVVPVTAEEWKLIAGLGETKV
jgi:predicted RNA-binding protein with PUA-like domain